MEELMAQGFWFPEHIEDMLSVDISPTQSGDSEWDGMILVNGASANWVNGTIDTGTYLDMLDSVGIEPLDFVRPVIEYLEYIL